MHWFDELAKGAGGGRPSRRTLLEGIAGLAAGTALGPFAAIAPAGAQYATPRPYSRASHGSSHASSSGMRSTPGIKVRRKVRPATLTRGACTTADGETTSSTFVATASSLRMTVRHEYAPAASAGRHEVAFTGQTIVDVTNDGASVLHLESRFESWNPKTQSRPDGSMTFRYGSAVRGASSATMASRNGTISGTIGGKNLASLAAHGGAPTSNGLADGHELALVAEPSLQQAFRELAGSISRDKATCAVKHHRTHASEVVSSDTRRLSSDLRGGGAYVLANANGYIAGSPTGQNSGVIGSEAQTPNCYNSVVDAGTDLAGCIAGSLAGAWICPPCAAYAIWGCYTAWGSAMVAFEAPGGACNQVGCNGNWDPGPKSCDTGFSCCGTYDCCPAGDICGQLGVCCPPEASLQCGTSYDDAYCCPTSTVCGPNQTCLGCPSGQVPQNGQCCNSICGSECCQSADATCDQARGKCIYPNFGSATAAPRRNGIDKCTRASGTVVCHSYYDAQTVVDICCSPGLNCCSGKCCPPGQTCGGNGKSLQCGNWIR